MNDDEILRLIRLGLASNDPDKLVAAYKLATSHYINFRPRPDNLSIGDQQYSFVNDQFDGIACALGGNRSGKSFCAAYKVAKFINDNPPPDKQSRWWVICQTMDMSAGICYAQHLEKFLPEAQVAEWYNKAKGWPTSILLPHKNGNNWLIEFKSYDMGRNALQGASICGYWADEQIEHRLLNEIDARTSNYNFVGNKLYTLTPLRPDYELEKIHAEQEKNPRWKFYPLNTRANTTINFSFLETALEEERETRARGVFASYSGSIYRNFNTSLHVVEPFEIPREWHRVAGVDFGFDHPTVCTFGAKDPAGRWYIYDEYVQAQNSIEEHVEAIKARWPGGTYYGDIWADHAAAQDRHEFAIRGLPTKAAQKDVIAGIASVQHLLRPGTDGKPKLMFFKNCENLIREMRTYQWNPNIDRKPMKRDDDSVDSLRYLIYSDGREIPKPIEGLKLGQNRHFNHMNGRR